jgi:hypothetical protein
MIPCRPLLNSGWSLEKDGFWAKGHPFGFSGVASWDKYLHVNYVVHIIESSFQYEVSSRSHLFLHSYPAEA